MLLKFKNAESFFIKPPFLLEKKYYKWFLKSIHANEEHPNRQREPRLADQAPKALQDSYEPYLEIVVQ